jgi:D-alanyl-D-alanine dipeptidase
MKTRRYDGPTRRHGFLAAWAALCLGTIAGTGAAFGQLAPGFVYLRDVDPTIRQDMRYYTDHNFVGRRIDGYEAPECILTRQAALALRRVQAELRREQLSLKVYDCYRPTRAVAHFVRWAKDPDDTRTKREFYLTLPKSKLFELGYIAYRSGHSRGSTVDLAIVPVPTPPAAVFHADEKPEPCTAPVGIRHGDNTLDFGTGFDCFSTLSHTDNPAIVGAARANRALLVAAMARHGFKNYEKEWWHFTLANEPFPETYFDFPIRPRRR